MPDDLHAGDPPVTRAPRLQPAIVWYALLRC